MQKGSAQRIEELRRAAGERSPDQGGLGEPAQPRQAPGAVPPASRDPGAEPGPHPAHAALPVYPPTPPPDAALRKHFRRLEEQEDAGSGGLPRWVGVGLPVVALAAALGSLYWNVSLRQQLTAEESSVAQLERENHTLSLQLQDTSTQLRDANDLQEMRGGSQPGTAGLSNPPGGLASPLPRTGISLPPSSRQPAAGFSGSAGPASTPAAAGSSAYSAGARDGNAESRTPSFPQLRYEEEKSRPELGIPRAGTVRAPESRGAGSPAPREATPRNAAQPPAASSVNAVYTDPMAQNIASVYNLQRHSKAKLYEFHVAEGSLTKPFPDLGIEVRKPDRKHGTYTLLVMAGTTRTPIKGRVDQPLLITQRPNGQRYQLIVLNISGNQIYGYLAEAH